MNGWMGEWMNEWMNCVLYGIDGWCWDKGDASLINEEHCSPLIQIFNQTVYVVFSINMVVDRNINIVIAVSMYIGIIKCCDVIHLYAKIISTIKIQW